jgi:hypothetical protein
VKEETQDAAQQQDQVQEETADQTADQTSEQSADQPGMPAAAPAIPSGMKRVRLTRSIVLGGKHSEAGSVHDVGQALAHRLVGEGSAEHTQPEKAPTSVNRMLTPGNADPAPREVSPAPAKGGPAPRGGQPRKANR